MSTTTGRAAPGRPTSERPTRSRSHGQWKVDGQEPLNPNEVFKAEDNGLNVRERVENVYSREGFASISADDLHGRLRWWGLYTQRRPGIDGGRTAQLEAHELEDEYFMLRVRIDGGALTTEQLRVVADVSTELARDTADITDRQNIQLHWVRIEDVPEIWRRLEAVGLQTTEACGDVPRVILGSPLAGVAADEIIDPTPTIAEITERFIGRPDLANLPRKFKSAITGHPSLDVVHEINDISLVGVVHPEHGVGYDLWVGGGLSTNPRLAERLGAFVRPDQAADVWHAVVQVFRDYGYRRLRNKARLKFLLADWGPEKFRQVLQDEYLGYDARGRARRRPRPPAPATTSACTSRRTDGGTSAPRRPSAGSAGRCCAPWPTSPRPRARSASRSPRTRSWSCSTSTPPTSTPWWPASTTSASPPRPSPFRRATMACTGIEYCKLAIVETKAAAATAISELERRLVDVALTTPITLNVNGCPNSCARIQTADIGLKGQLIPGPDGEPVPGFQVHLGGGLASVEDGEAGLGRTVRGLKVTADDLPDYVERVVRRWTADRDADETFARWAHRADEEALT